MLSSSSGASSSSSGTAGLGDLLAGTRGSFANIVRLDKLGKIYFQSFCRSLGRSLIRLFVPAYLLSNGYSLGQIILQYYVISYLVWTLSAFVVIKVVSTWTARSGFLAAALIGILDSWMLFNMKQFSIPLVIVAVAHGTTEAFFWSSYHYYFIKVSSSESRGRTISLIRILAKTGKVVGPALGGWLLHDQRTDFLLGLSSILLLLSIVPIWLDDSPESASKRSTTPNWDPEDGPGNNNNNKSQQFPALSNRALLSRESITWLCLVASGVEKSLGNSIWPLYCALTFFGERIHIFGMFSSAILALSLLLTYAMGKFVDSDRSAPLKLGGGLSASMWLLRLLVSTPWQVALVDSCYNWSSALLHISFFASVYDLADRSDLLSFTLRQEMAISCGEIIAWSLAWMVLPGAGTSGGSVPGVGQAPFPRVLFLLGIVASALQSGLVAWTSSPKPTSTIVL